MGRAKADSGARKPDRRSEEGLRDERQAGTNAVKKKIKDCEKEDSDVFLFFQYRMIDRFFGENFDYCALKYQRKGIKVNKKKSVSGGLSLYVILLHFFAQFLSSSCYCAI